MPRPASPLAQAITAGLQGFQQTFIPGVMMQLENEEKLRVSKILQEQENELLLKREEAAGKRVLARE